GNRPPTLFGISDKALYLGQTLSFTAVATDPDAPQQSLSFSLDAGAPAGASIQSSAGLFVWTPSAEQAPSTNYVTVRVVDNGSPPLDDRQTFAIFVLLPPRFVGISRS